MRLSAVCAILFFLSGCAHYEYNLIQPADVAGHIGVKADTVIPLDPLTFRLRSYDNRLVMRIYNDGNDPIELLGGKSAVVDPQGESHPLRDRTIATQSFIKLIFPPPRPRLYDSGPTIGIGIGGGFGRRDWRYNEFYSPFYPDDGPREVYLYDGGDAYSWDWTGTGIMRLSLIFRAGDKTFDRSFSFGRTKM